MPLQPGLQPATVVTRRPAAFPGQFEELLTAQQRAKVAADISLRDRVKNAGDLNQQFAQSVHLKPELQGRIFNDTEKWHEVDRFLDAKAWEICRMLRGPNQVASDRPQTDAPSAAAFPTQHNDNKSSRPCRITDATELLKEIIDRSYKANPDLIDTTPLLYYAVALCLTPGREQDAEKAFEEAFDASNINVIWHNGLWAKAHRSRMLRRLGRENEALVLEQEIRKWWRDNTYKLSPARFREIVLDPQHQGQDFILDTREGKKLFRGMRDLGKGVFIHDPTESGGGNYMCNNCEDMSQDKKKFQRCSTCHVAYYCSRDCQKAHWPEHKKICKPGLSPSVGPSHRTMNWKQEPYQAFGYATKMKTETGTLTLQASKSGEGKKEAAKVEAEVDGQAESDNSSEEKSGEEAHEK